MCRFLRAAGVDERRCCLSMESDCTCSVHSQLLPGTKLIWASSSPWTEGTPSKVKESGFLQLRLLKVKVKDGLKHPCQNWGSVNKEFFGAAGKKAKTWLKENNKQMVGPRSSHSLGVGIDWPKREGHYSGGGLGSLAKKIEAESQDLGLWQMLWENWARKKIFFLEDIWACISSDQSRPKF